MNPRYPVYIISKGRSDSRLTSKALELINVPYHIVIEKQEYGLYAEHIHPSKILVLPFSNLGKGSIPARNWVWCHSLKRGAKRHWIIDDNIYYFCRLNRNTKIRVDSGTIFRCAEDFTDRYENVALSGFNYQWFAPARTKQPAFRVNRRIYSCILVNNHIEHRWRGRYNEDTDLSLRVMLDGWCTILFQAFLADKVTTMTMKGGNEEIYANGRLEFVKSLMKQHPYLVTHVNRYGRDHHHVNYDYFRKNKLKLKKNLNILEGINNYGMILIDKETGKEIKFNDS
jgi:hypothetical protein